MVQQCNANLKHVDSGVDSDSLTATTKLTVRIKDAAHLQNLISNLKKVRSVNEVIRAIQYRQGILSFLVVGLTSMDEINHHFAVFISR